MQTVYYRWLRPFMEKGVTYETNCRIERAITIVTLRLGEEDGDDHMAIPAGFKHSAQYMYAISDVTIWQWH